MAKENQKQISLSFIVIMAVLIAVTTIYIAAPSERLQKSKKKLSYQEKLAELKKAQNEKIQKERNNGYLQEYKYKTYTTTPVKKNEPEFTILDINAKPDIKYAQPKKSKAEFYQELLTYPHGNINDIQRIVDAVNVNNGYPSGIVRVIEKNDKTATARVPGSYIIGTFDAGSGNIYIDYAAIRTLPPQYMIPVIAHELDHFDKIIKICKSMGAENYLNLLKSYGIQSINEDFWKRNANYADITNFDSKTYTDALKRILDKNNIDMLSSYANFYLFTEAMRNPIEISGYAVSDNLEKSYGINKTEGIMRQISKEFNKVDWAVYSMVEKDNILKNERIAVFDYLFAKAIINKFPDTKNIFDDCIYNKKGNLTEFWHTYERKLPGFYGANGQIDQNTFYALTDLLKNTEEIAKYPLTSAQFTEALRLKLNTTANNTIYQGNLNRLQKTAEDMLVYMLREHTLSSEDELHCCLLLICIENNHTPISLYDIVIPEFLKQEYNQTGKGQKFNFIYNNSAFKEYCASRIAANSALNDQIILTEMLERNAIDLK